MYKVFYFLYCFIGLVLFITFLVAIFFVVPALDQFEWVPNIVREAIYVTNNWETRTSTFILSWQQMRILAFLVLIFIAFVRLVSRKKHIIAIGKDLIIEQCIALSFDEKIRCSQLIDGIQLHMKTEESEINAYAYGDYEIAISQGAINKCSDSELIGLIAHELGHVECSHSFFSNLARQGEFYYSSIYEFIKFVVEDIFWGMIAKLFLVFSPFIAVLLFSPVESEVDQLPRSRILLFSFIVVILIVYWVGSKIPSLDVIKWFANYLDKVMKQLSRLSLCLIKFLFYNITVGWMLRLGDTLEEYEADRYAAEIGYGEELLQAFLHMQGDLETYSKLKLPDKIQFNRRKKKLIKMLACKNITN